MRIMYLLFSFTVGGTERLVANICNQMILQNEEVYLYIVNDLVDQSILNTLDKKVHIKLFRRKVGSKDKISPIIEIAKYIKSNNIDVVHCNSFNSPELLILSKILNPKCKIVITIHGIGQFKSISKFKIEIRKRICDLFIGISDAVKDDILSAGISDNKVIRVYNGIDTTKYDNAVLKKFEKKRIVLGCIARIMPSVKGQDILLKTIKTLKMQFSGIKVMFAGGIAENQKESYEELVKYVSDNNIQENVEFLGSVEKVSELLNKIDICIIPSRSEGFGLVLVEAMAMGVPCIVSNIAGPKEIVENEGLGQLFECGNEVDLQNKIVETINNFEEYKKIAWAKRDNIKKRYSIENMCIKLLDIYKE